MKPSYAGVGFGHLNWQASEVSSQKQAELMLYTAMDFENLMLSEKKAKFAKVYTVCNSIYKIRQPQWMCDKDGSGCGNWGHLQAPGSLGMIQLLGVLMVMSTVVQVHSFI